MAVLIWRGHGLWYMGFQFADKDNLNTSLEPIDAAKLFSEFSACRDRLELLQKAQRLLRDYTGFSAVAIRFKDNHDFTFMVSDGFSPDFLAKESPLLEPSHVGCPDKHHHLACHCGRIISEAVDSNSRELGTGVHVLPPEDDHKPVFAKRGTCWHCGYRSMLRIPLFDANEVFGLILLNDPRPDLVNAELQQGLSRISFVLSVCLSSYNLVYFRQELDDWQKNLLRSRAEFLNRINHELRTPLSGLLGLLNLMEGEQGREEYLELLTAAKVCARDLSVKIYNLLDHSKQYMGKYSFYPREFSAAKLLHEVCAEFICRAQSRGLQFTVQISPKVPQKFVSDDKVFVRVITNLLDNALKFTQKGGIKVCLDIEQQPSFLVLIVSDTGIGFLHPDQVEKHFEPFCLLESVYDRQHEGLGLGLSIASGLLKAMGGEIAIESKSHQGSEITCRFPALAREEKSLAEALKNVQTSSELTMPIDTEADGLCKPVTTSARIYNGMAEEGYAFLDYRKILSNLNGDYLLLREVLNIVLKEMPVVLHSLFEAVSQNNWLLVYQLICGLQDVVSPLGVSEINEDLADLLLIFKHKEYRGHQQMVFQSDHPAFKAEVSRLLKRLFVYCGVLSGELSTLILELREGEQ